MLGAWLALTAALAMGGALSASARPPSWPLLPLTAFAVIVVVTRQRSTGQATLQDMIRVAGEVKNGDEYDRIINDQYATPSGFIRFAQVNHGAWLSVYGIRRRTVRWILGNPTLAVTMIRHDVNAGLFVPVELLLTEQSEGRGTASSTSVRRR